MLKQLAGQSHWIICGLLLLTACVLAPSPSYPNTNQINDTLLTDPTDEGGHGEQAPLCFVPREFVPVAISADNAQIAIRSQLGIQFISLVSGEEIAFYKAPLAIIAAELSPDGQQLAWALEDNSIQIIRLSDGTPRYTLTGHPDPVLHILFSPSGDELYSASHDGLVRIWKTESGLLQGSIEIGLEVVGIGVSGDGLLLATVPSDGPIQLWDLRSGSLATSLGGTGGFDTSNPVFSVDGAFLAADLATGLNIWAISDGQDIWDEAVNSMAAVFSSDGSLFAFSDINDSNRIAVMPSSFEGSSRTIGYMQSPVWAMFFSPDSSLLIASDGVEIRVWRVSDGSLIAVGKATCP